MFAPLPMFALPLDNNFYTMYMLLAVDVNARRYRSNDISSTFQGKYYQMNSVLFNVPSVLMYSLLYNVHYVG